MKKSHLIATTVASLSLAALLGVGFASPSNATNSQTSLVDKLAAKFNLKKADVQAVFDQNHLEHQVSRTAHEKTRLDQLVADGKITNDQEAKIIARQAETTTLLVSLKDKTEDEREAAMKAQRTADQKWAADNNIPLQYLRFGRHGFGGHGRHMDKETDDDGPATPVTNTTK